VLLAAVGAVVIILTALSHLGPGSELIASSASHGALWGINTGSKSVLHTQSLQRGRKNRRDAGRVHSSEGWCR
jgi:hypothetical protein